MKHPITGLPFDYDHVCGTCIHFDDKTRTNRGLKYRTTKCALDPQQRNLADDINTSWKAMPSCTRHKPLAN